jgi:nucleoid-associated protein YgaU
MKHETKLGLAFIGILLVIFVGLLMKRLARPGNAMLSHLQKPSTSSTAEPAPGKVAFQPAQPTLVTPKAQSGRPPESTMADNSGNHADKHALTRANHPLEHEQSVSSTEQAPSLLATPLPVTEVGDRYAKSHESPESSQERSPVSAAQPYRSGYAAANENHSDPLPSASVTSNDKPSQLEPEPAREKPDFHSSTASRYGDTPTAESRHDEPHQHAEPYGMQPTASSRTPEVPSYRNSTSPSTNDRYSAGVRTAEVYPISTDVAPPTPHYPSRELSVASTGTIVPAAGIQRDGDQYTVQPNDSFWNISERAYGTGAFFKALYEHNRKKHPESDEMKVGQVLSVPDEAVLRRAYPDLCPKPHKQVMAGQQRLASASSRMRGAGRVYTVEDGDTLFEIARRELGKTSRWAEIYDLNRDVLGNDFDYLHPGLELILPDEKPHNDDVTRQPASVYPR